MSEVYQERAELQPHVAIAQVFHDWLTTEIITSSTNQNAVLDNWAKFREELELPFTDPGNVAAQKAKSHFGRLELWTKEFGNGHVDDAAIAHQIYGALTGMSGAFRVQCYVFAASQEVYSRHRQDQGPLELNIKDRVQSRLEQHFGHLPSPEELAHEIVLRDELIEATKSVNESRLKILTALYDDKRSLQGLRRQATLMRLIKQQGDWLDLGIDYVLYAAQRQNGDLTKVPFMEPLPITQAEIEYPFAKLFE